MGKYFSRAWQIYRQYPLTILPLVIMYVIMMIVSLVYLYVLEHIGQNIIQDPFSAISIIVVTMILMTLIFAVASVIGMGANLGLIRRAMAADPDPVVRKPLRGAATAGIKRFSMKYLGFTLMWVAVFIVLGIILTIIIMILMLGIGLSSFSALQAGAEIPTGGLVFSTFFSIFLVVVAAVFISPAYMFGEPAIALGNKGGFGAFVEGWRVLKGRYWKSILVVFITVAIAVVLIVLPIVCIGLGGNEDIFGIYSNFTTNDSSMNSSVYIAYNIYTFAMGLIICLIAYYFRLVFFAMYEDTLDLNRPHGEEAVLPLMNTPAGAIGENENTQVLLAEKEMTEGNPEEALEEDHYEQDEASSFLHSSDTEKSGEGLDEGNRVEY